MLITDIVGKGERRTRKVSPQIIGGAVLPVLSTGKNTDTQVSWEICWRVKSAVEMGQETLLDPHETSICGASEQASYTGPQRTNERMLTLIPDG